jgi:hypothetical protein
VSFSRSASTSNYVSASCRNPDQIPRLAEGLKKQRTD